MSSQSANTASNLALEDRIIYGFGPDHRMPHSCPSCLGTPRLVNDCHACDGTGLVWDTSSDSIYQGEEKQHSSPGGSSPESSSLSSYDRQD
ncbi:hypothetical protein F4813DRAFT_393459 [Daldinia decipiens]|uniref:uncharacterized protein n=1 Tax=Daldinia decipiens TaxID=326647 RepID=UPI0020C2F6AE|nr:uncharacterized protein F4813DRAFT_393459 [Daldinia decipiens]KAI1653695.1 hypothetical protein F4813DRAFT_393459 [Daldinia decipiens]